MLPESMQCISCICLQSVFVATIVIVGTENEREVNVSRILSWLPAPGGGRALLIIGGWGLRRHFNAQ
jgi:hypothetical protein